MFCPFHQYYPIFIGVFTPKKDNLYSSLACKSKAIVLEITRLSGETADGSLWGSSALQLQLGKTLTLAEYPA